MITRRYSITSWTTWARPSGSTRYVVLLNLDRIYTDCFAQVTVRPSINQHERNLALQEPLRETTRHLQRLKTQDSSEKSVGSGGSTSSLASPSSSSVLEKAQPVSSTLAPKTQLTPSPHTDISPLAKANAAAAAVMERQAFAIDEAGDDDGLDDSDFGDSVDIGDDVLDEVDAFLEANDHSVGAKR
jgi:hypothetical protein